jgi:hypothetical protein
LVFIIDSWLLDYYYCDIVTHMHSYMHTCDMWL